MADPGERWRRLSVRVDLLGQAVRCLALGGGSLEQRLADARVPIARIAQRDLESEAELALYARVRLGLSRLPSGEQRSCSADTRQQVPVFALEATAAHIIDLYEVTANRVVRAARARRRQKR